MTEQDERVAAARLRRLEQYRDEVLRSTRNLLILSSVMAALCLLYAISTGKWIMLQHPLFVIGAVGAIAGSWELWRTKRLTLDELEQGHRDVGRVRAVVFTRRPWLTLSIAAALLIVAAIQLACGLEASIAAAGLVKSAVRQGELWRLMTAETLHGSGAHLWFNLAALIALGRAVENIGGRGAMATTFVLSALGASVFSLLLMPNTTSIGASGGIMGLAGFVLVAAHYRRQVLPGMVRGMLISVAFVALSGVLGFAVIDNAAHLGGFLTGACFAFFAIDRRGDAVPVVRPGAAWRWLGGASLAIFAAASVAASVLTIRGW